jgi:hypothetical protein
MAKSGKERPSEIPPGVAKKSDKQTTKGGRALKRLKQQQKSRGLPTPEIDAEEGVLDLGSSQQNEKPDKK